MTSAARSLRDFRQDHRVSLDHGVGFKKVSVPRSPCSTESFRPFTVRSKREKRSDELLTMIIGGYQEPGHVWDDDFPDPSDVRGDDRTPDGHRLEKS
jgi:hypothetical protein